MLTLIADRNPLYCAASGLAASAITALTKESEKVMVVAHGTYTESNFLEALSEAPRAAVLPFRVGMGIPLKVSSVVEEAVKNKVDTVFFAAYEPSSTLVTPVDDLVKALQAKQIKSVIEVSPCAFRSMHAFSTEPHAIVLSEVAEGVGAVIASADVAAELMTKEEATPAIPATVAVDELVARRAALLGASEGLFHTCLGADEAGLAGTAAVNFYMPRAVVYAGAQQQIVDSLNESALVAKLATGFLREAAFSVSLIAGDFSKVGPAFETVEKVVAQAVKDVPADVSAPADVLILLAGGGTRLRPYLKEPVDHKSLVPLCDDGSEVVTSRMLKQLKTLRREGLIGEIRAVLGCNADILRAKIQEFDDATDKIPTHTCVNEIWATTNTAGSARCALDHWTTEEPRLSPHKDIVVVNGDVVTETVLYRNVIAFPGFGIAVGRQTLVTDAPADEEAVKTLLTKEGDVREIGKWVAEGTHEAVGVYRVPALHMLKVMNSVEEPSKYFDDQIHAAIKATDELHRDVHGVDVTGVDFVEIDFKEDYDRAKVIHTTRVVKWE